MNLETNLFARSSRRVYASMGIPSGDWHPRPFRAQALTSIKLYILGVMNACGRLRTNRLLCFSLQPIQSKVDVFQKLRN
jgi:hypothetical protein